MKVTVTVAPALAGSARDTDRELGDAACGSHGGVTARTTVTIMIMMTVTVQVQFQITGIRVPTN